MVFLLPPSIEELRNRLIKRNTEAKEVIDLRINKANHELKMQDRFDYRIINDNVNKASRELHDLILKEIKSKLMHNYILNN